MNQLKTSSNEDLVDTKPLFASTWVALFTVLRKNYNERHLVAHGNTGNPQTTKLKQSEQKLNLRNL